MIIINSPAAFEAISKATQTPYAPLLDTCVAKIDPVTKEIIGGGLLCSYTGVGGSVQCHIAGFRKNWLDKIMLYAYFDVAFNHLRVTKMLGIVPEHNKRALKLDRHLGMRDECRIEDVFTYEGKPCAGIILSMTRDQCRFLESPKPRVVRMTKELTDGR